MLYNNLWLYLMNRRYKPSLRRAGDNVLELQVVTGSGSLETCSREQNRDLFEAVLAGLGQCGIIVRATVRLVPSAQNARVFLLFYRNLAGVK